MQNLTSAQFEQMLDNIGACESAKMWAIRKDWQTIYATASAKDLVWLFVRTQREFSCSRKTFANIICDILRPMQDKMLCHICLIIFSKIKAWGDGEYLDIQKLVKDVYMIEPEQVAYYAARAVYCFYFLDNHIQTCAYCAGAVSEAAIKANADLGAILRQHAPIESWDFSNFLK